MQAFRDMPLRLKLRLLMMATSTAALVLACLGFVIYEFLTYQGTMTRQLTSLASVTGANSAAALMFGDAAAAQKNLAAFEVQPGIEAACIYGADGKVLATYTRANLHGWTPAVSPPDAVTFDTDQVTLSQPIIQKGERIGTIYLQSDMREMYERLGRYAGIVLLVFASSLGISLLLSARLQGLISEPILSLVETARAVSAKNDYSLRATRQGDDELGRLMDSFNEMLAQIQARDEALRRSNRELQDFAYVASHDLQEPLRKIQAFGDRLKTKFAPALAEDGRDYLERMQNAASRMQTLINDLLAYSRITTNAQPFVPVDLRQITREVLGDLEVRIEQTQGRVVVGELPTVDADPLQMRQLLQNLIGNALKFNREYTHPIVKVYAQPVNGAAPGPDGNGARCQLFVEDNGIGFDMKYLDRVFGMFQRLHGRDQYEGTGVGLAICRKIAERHGGEITAKSGAGQGATFIVTLPVHHPNTGGVKS
jgi:signal transduction histidine kinase